MKSISTMNPAITENAKHLTVKALALFINLKVGVLLDHDVSQRFALLLAFQTYWVTFRAENNVRGTPASPALTQSCTKTIRRALQIVTYEAEEKEIELRGEQR